MSPRPPKAGRAVLGGGGRLAGALVMALLGASCGAAPMETADPSPPPPPAAEESPGSPQEPTPEESPEPAEERIPVPSELRFTAPELGGGQIRGAEYAGRDVAIWFWAPW